MLYHPANIRQGPVGVTQSASIGGVFEDGAGFGRWGIDLPIRSGERETSVTMWRVLRRAAWQHRGDGTDPAGKAPVPAHCAGGHESAIRPTQIAALGSSPRTPDRASRSRLRRFVMPTSGQACQRDGLYQGSCGHRHRFEQGSDFPRCPECGGKVHWSWQTF